MSSLGRHVCGGAFGILNGYEFQLVEATMLGSLLGSKLRSLYRIMFFVFLLWFFCGCVCLSVVSGSMIRLG